MVNQQIIPIWKWKKKARTIAELRDRRKLAKIYKMYCVNAPDWEKVRNSDIVLVTGDAFCVDDDVKKFESWNIPYDLFCVNRSMLRLNRPLKHWAAVDAEESAWFASYFTKELVPPDGKVCRHTVGRLPIAYDYFWMVDVFEDGDYVGNWMGNSGYFAILASLEMGYKKIVIAGMPLDNSRHWYDEEGVEGPNWIGRAYTQWMDFKIKVPAAEKVRSMSGYTAFILGQATKEWINGESERR